MENVIDMDRRVALCVSEETETYSIFGELSTPGRIVRLRREAMVLFILLIRLLLYHCCVVGTGNG